MFLVPVRIVLPLLAACAGAPLDSGQTGEAYVGDLIEGGALTCAAPSARAEAPFVAPEWGADWSSQPVSVDHPFGAGLVVADFSGDGKPDIFIPEEGQDRLYVRVDDGTLADETATRLPLDAGDGESASTADYDGDGDLDLYVGNHGENWLLRNDDGAFSMVEAGVGDGEHYTTGSAWADIDGDDDLDLLVLNHQVNGIDSEAAAAGALGPGDPNGLYENDGSGGFISISERLLGGAADGYSFAGGFPDLDGDLDPDLYVVNDMGPLYAPNMAMLNDGGSFSAFGNGLDMSAFGMGLGVGDLNDDLLPDFLVPSWEALYLLMSDENGAWYESALAMGIAPGSDQHIGWGGNLEDLDNDGDLDALSSFGKLWLPAEESAVWEAMGLSNPALQRDGLWVQEDGRFSEMSAEWGLDALGVGRGIAVYDLDGDGFLDLLKRPLNAPATAFMARCDDHGWLAVDLANAVGGNRFGIGARVVVLADDTRQVRWVHAGGRDLSTGTGPTEHFGLGNADSVTLLVDWPDGEQSRFSNVATRQRVVVSR